MTTSTDTKKPVGKEQVPDVEVIVPEPGRIVIDGIDCKVDRLKTRELLALLRVITAGLGPSMSEIDLDFSDDEQIGNDLIALVILAVPNAADDFALFLMQIVSPVDPEKNTAVSEYLSGNPDIDVLLDVFETVAVQEKDDLGALMGKARSMWGRVATLYRPKKKKQKPTG